MMVMVYKFDIAGMDEDAIAKILKKHEKDLAHLEEQQEQDRQAQMNNFKVNLWSMWPSW